MSQRPNLKDYSIERLRARFAEDGLPPYRADQVAGWLYRRGVDDLGRMSDLGIALRGQLEQGWETRALEIADLEKSRDGTVKAVLRTRVGDEVESVLIPEEDRTTLCISTQIGCAMACRFCATGFMGFQRNLTTAEIIDQVCRMQHLVGAGRRLTNVVFMGMGEPLLNLPAVMEAVRILVHPKAFAMAPRRVTVSTVGVVSRIRELLEATPVNLAVSLHATTDEVRDELVPLNRRFPLRVLLAHLRRLDSITVRRPIFFEYTLIEGVNDSVEDARRLPSLLEGLHCKMNLIPMNSHRDSPYRPPAEEVIDAFLRIVAGSGLRVTLRRPRGEDIDAACGQLALRRGGEVCAAGPRGPGASPSLDRRRAESSSGASEPKS